MPKAAKDTKKKPAKKEKKDPNAPKKPLSAYMMFAGESRASIKAENPDASFGEIGKIQGAKWKEMTADEKKPYEEKAAADKKRYEREMADYVPPAKPAAAAASDDDE